MAINHEAIINKAVFNMATLANGGKLNPEQANRFIDKIIDMPTIIKDCRVERMNSDRKFIEKIGFGSRILIPATEGTDPGSGSYKAPTTSKIELVTKEVMAVVPITDDTIENNIERTNINSHIMSLIAERVALDQEEWIVNADTAHATDNYLKLGDGVRKLAVTHVVDAKKAAFSKDLFKQAKKALPNKYMRNARDWRFYTSYNVETDWQDTFATRQTAGGDTSLSTSTVFPCYGIPVKGIAMLQEYDTGDGVKISDSLLVNPKNIILGISRDIRFETERRPRERMTYVVVTLKMDVKLEEPDAIVKISQIKE